MGGPGHESTNPSQVAFKAKHGQTDLARAPTCSNQSRGSPGGCIQIQSTPSPACGHCVQCPPLDPGKTGWDDMGPHPDTDLLLFPHKQSQYSILKGPQHCSQHIPTLLMYIALPHYMPHSAGMKQQTAMKATWISQKCPARPLQ